MTDWTIVTRSLRVRLFSTLTTVLMVAVGVGLMVVLLTLRAAAWSSFDRGTGNVHLLVSRDASPLASVLNGLFYAAPPPKPITYAEFETISKKYPLEWCVPIQLGDSYKGAWPVLATEETFFTKFRPAEDAAWEYAAGGRFNKDFEVVVGASAARGTGLKVGDKIVLTHGIGGSRAGAIHEHDEVKYTVVGVLRPTGTIHDRALFTNLQSTWLIHAFDRLEREGKIDHDHDAKPDANPAEPAKDDHADEHAHDDHDHDHDHSEFAICEEDLTPADRLITNIFIRVLTRPGSDVTAAMPVVSEQIKRDPMFQAAPFTVAAPRFEVDRLKKIVGNVDVVLLAMAAVVMISSSIAIMLALYNSMEQRRRQIAVLRVLGASPARIFSLVLTESAVIGLAGTFAGVAVGFVGSHLASGVLKNEMGIVVSPDLEPQVLGAISLATFLLACLAGVIPAMMAYRTGVAKNLRPIA